MRAQVLSGLIVGAAGAAVAGIDVAGAAATAMGAEAATGAGATIARDEGGAERFVLDLNVQSARSPFVHTMRVTSTVLTSPFMLRASTRSPISTA